MNKAALALRNSAQQAQVWRTTYLRVSGQALDESVIPVDLLEDDQTLPSLAIVIGVLLMVALKEQSKIGKAGGLEPDENSAKKQLTRVPRDAT